MDLDSFDKFLQNSQLTDDLLDENEISQAAQAEVDVDFAPVRTVYSRRSRPEDAPIPSVEEFQKLNQATESTSAPIKKTVSAKASTPAIKTEDAQDDICSAAPVRMAGVPRAPITPIKRRKEVVSSTASSSSPIRPFNIFHATEVPKIKSESSSREKTVSASTSKVIDLHKIDDIAPLKENSGKGVGLGIHRGIEASGARKHSTEKVINIIESDDDDVIEIKYSNASTSAQAKWKASRNPIFINNKESQVTVKQEPEQEVSPKAPNEAEARRLEVERKLAKQRASLFGRASTSRVAGQKRRRGSTTEILDDFMNANEDDDSWMHEELEPDKEYENLKAERDALEQKEKKKPLNPQETVDLYRVRNSIKLKERLMAASKKLQEHEEEEDEENSLFIPETHPIRPIRRTQSPGEGPSERPQSPKHDGDEAFENDESFARMLHEELNGPVNKDVPNMKKQRRKPAKNAREVVERQREDEAERQKNLKDKVKKRRSRPKVADNQESGKGSSRKKPTAKGKGKQHASRRGRPSKKTQEKSTSSSSKKRGVKADTSFITLKAMVPRGQTFDETAKQFIDDLLNNDPIADRLQNPIFNMEPEPEISTGNKATQLQQLFANIPKGSDAAALKNDRVRLKEASKYFGYAGVKAVNGKWRVKGMTSTLYHHQLLGASWMVSRELSLQAPYGGLLADGMGLGKTVQTIACMVGNPPTTDDIQRGITATLIVAPSSIISQWIEELTLHTEPKTFPKVLHYKSSMKIPASVLSDCDVVLTSYTEVMRQFPFPDKKARELIMQIGRDAWWKDAKEELGLLHRLHWRRIVLDESHNIKNNAARTSLACQHLKSVYRWCLTGTPILNRLEELFPYFRFLKTAHSLTWDDFRRYFCDSNADDCQARINILLSYSMMRRTMKTTILGRPIITLPPPHPKIEYIEFSKEERMIYRITENRFRANLNVFFEKGTAARNYATFMVQLLRLRQCTSHPFMLERTIKESWTSEDVAQLKKILGRLSQSAKPFYEQCELWVTQSEKERAEARERGEAEPENAPKVPFGLSDYGDKFEFDKALETLREDELYSRVTCKICSDFPIEPLITTCSHIFCTSCLHDYLHKRTAEFDELDEENIQICPWCDMLFQEAKPYKDLRIQDDDNMDNGSPSSQSSTFRSSSGSSKRQKKDKNGDSHYKDQRLSKGRDALGFEPSTLGDKSNWVSKSDTDPNFPLIPSAKTTALKATLLKSFDEAPLDKVVIYTQFRTLARIIGRMCSKEGWGFLYLTGDSSLDHRTKAIKMFRDDVEIKILIAGLKCGGLGLNFPWANRCISLDLWWNHAVEQQAFGRIFRIGQIKETYMTRIVVKNSVDIRLLSMQKHKLKTCEQAMQDDSESDGSGRRRINSTLTLGQVANLFGFLKTDKDGEIISVEPDYEPEDGEEDDGDLEEVGEVVDLEAGDRDEEGEGSGEAEGEDMGSGSE